MLYRACRHRAPQAQRLICLPYRLRGLPAGCAAGHNFTPIRTIYRWQGQIHDRTEARVALRTRRELIPEIVERTKQQHPYEIPSIVATPIFDGNPDYIDWILAETRASR